MASQIPFESLDPMTRNPDPKYIVQYAKQNAKQGDPGSVVKAVDEFCAKYARRSMHVGKTKGAIVDKIIRDCNPSIAIELGGFYGYSAVRFASLLKPGAKYYSIELDSDYADLVSQMVEFAGLSERVTVINASSETTIPVLKEKYGIDKVDFVFIDHWKTLYKSDTIKLVESGLLKKGSVLAADNVIYPGAPDYLEYIRNNASFESTFFESHLESDVNIKDGIEKSVFIG